MATIAPVARQERLAQWRSGVKQSVRRTTALLAGGAVGALAILAGLALLSYHPTDPALNTAAAGPVRNWIGMPGAIAADLLLSLFGPAAGLLLAPVLLTGLRIARGAGRGRWLKSLLLTMTGAILIGAAASLVFGGAFNGLPAAWGGAFGLSLARLADAGFGALGQSGFVPPLRMATVALAGLGGVALAWFGLSLAPDERQWTAPRCLPKPQLRLPRPDADPLPEPADRPARAPVVAPAEPPRTVIAERSRAPERAARPSRDRQASLALG